MKVMEAIIPCQGPSQNPATFPSSSGELDNVFGPAVHPANVNIIYNLRAMIKKAGAFFIEIIPSLQGNAPV
jgi:hypothetical protein